MIKLSSLDDDFGETVADDVDVVPLSQRQATTLMVSVFIIAICGLVYELIVGTLSSYLWGNSVTHFSITIGLFMSAMGVGSWASRWLKGDVLTWFIRVEIAIGVVGGCSAFLLYAVFATTEWYYVVMALIILWVGGCVGLEIPLLTELAGGTQSLRDTLSNVLAFDYLGALLGAILFPIFLLPYLGLLQTAFVIGLLNMGVAVGIIAMFWRRLRRQGPRLLGMAAVAMILLLSGAVYANSLSSFFEKQLYDDEIIYTAQTPYQRIVMTRWRNDVRLFLDGNLQFSLLDEYRYHESLVHPAMLLTASRERVLVLGGGDGLVVRELLQYEDVAEIVLVDIDPAITGLAQDHPTLRLANGNALADARVQIVHADAYNYLEENEAQFGVIIIDLPDPNNESLGKLYSQTFYKLLQRNLGVGGVAVTQATSPYFAREAYWSIVTTAEAAAWHTTPYHVYVPSFGDWGFSLLTATPLPDTNLAAALDSQELSLKYLNNDAWLQAQTFDRDISRVSVAVNRLDTQILLRYYEDGWQQWR